MLQYIFYCFPRFHDVGLKNGLTSQKYDVGTSIKIILLYTAKLDESECNIAAIIQIFEKISFALTPEHHRYMLTSHSVFVTV